MSILLAQVEEQIKKCHKCRLSRTRTNTVPGSGPEDAKIAFIGEAPGYNEDKQGKPFVGKAGRLLDQLLRSVRISRRDVWIGNILKCRPPRNRDPHVDEIRSCSPYLDLQLQEIHPELVCTLGRFATKHFLGDILISEEHGHPIKVGHFIVLPLYHPAAALRSNSVLKDLKKDFKVIPEVLQGDVEIKRVSNNDNEDQISLL